MTEITGEKLGWLEGMDDKRAVGIEVGCIYGCKDCKILGNVERKEVASLPIT